MDDGDPLAAFGAPAVRNKAPTSRVWPLALRPSFDHWSGGRYTHRFLFRGL